MNYPFTSLFRVSFYAKRFHAFLTILTYFKSLISITLACMETNIQEENREIIISGLLANVMTLKNLICSRFC